MLLYFSVLQAIIMITYYAAQLGISLSVVDSKASYLDSLRDVKPQTDMQRCCSQPVSDSEDELRQDCSPCHIRASFTDDSTLIQRKIVSMNSSH